MHTSAATQAGSQNVTELAAKRRKFVGRKDSDNQEAVIKLSEVKDRIDYLVGLHNAAKDAGAELNDGIKAIAEKSGLLASVVRKYVVAKAGDKYEEEERKVQQLSLIFEIEEPAKESWDTPAASEAVAH